MADLDRHGRAVDRASKGRGRGLASRGVAPGGRVAAVARAEDAAAGNSSDGLVRDRQRDQQPRRPVRRAAPAAGEQPWDRVSALHPSRQQAGVWEQSQRQSRATRKAAPVTSVQLALDLGDTPVDGEVSGLPEMSASERVRAELEILGLDVSRHVVEFYDPFLDAIGVTRSHQLLERRSRSELLVAGVKVATQTPPIRSGRRVVFLTLDDGTGPVDATFFEDVQGPYAATVFHSWLLVVRGELRRTGRRGVSLRATGCWELPVLHEAWRDAGTGPRSRRGPRPDGGGPRGLRCRRRAGRAGGGREPVDPAGGGRPTGRPRARPAGWAGAGCWCTPAVSRCRPTPTSSPPARTPSPRPASSGTRPPAAPVPSPDRWVRRSTRWGQALGWASCQLSARAPVSSGAAPPARPWCGTPCARCSRPGTPTGRPPWSTSVAAPAGSRSGSPSSATGWSSSTPARTLWPTLSRRADESGVADLVTGRQGDLATLPDLVPDGSADVVLCHGVLEIVDDPAVALAALAGVLRPGGTLSLLVNQRHAAVVTRAMAGHFTAARALLETGSSPDGAAGTGRRFTADEVTAVLDAAGLETEALQGVRVFVDLVPSSLVDLEPGAAEALVELERAVATRPEYLTLATQIHAVATRR